MLFATLVAGVAAGAYADNVTPKTFTGHGVLFSYPGSWSELSPTFRVQIGSALWTESIGPVALPPAAPPSGGPQPQPTPTPQPPAIQADLVTVAAYHVSAVVTARNIARYKPYIALAVSQLATQAHGQVLSGPIRVNVARMPGYSFQVTAQLSEGSTAQSRIALVFHKKTEYFFNCQYPQNDPLAAEVEAGCDQVMRSFRLRP